MALNIGIDVGGTFTDICVWDDEAGETVTTVLKVPSTYPNPAEGIFNGLDQLRRQTQTPVSRLVQGSTIATNAMLERSGSESAMIVTKGFRDLIEIGRQTRSDLYNLQMDKPVAVVPRSLRYEVSERIAADGRVLESLDEAEARAVLTELRAAGVDSLSICLLHSYRYPQHELRLAVLAREILPEVYVSLSHQVHGEFREFERFNTTAVNAYLGPVLRRYVEDVDAYVESESIDAPTFYTQSNGGLIPPEIAKEMPCRLLLSGPAAGVAGAAFIAEQEGVGHVITLDMGGTSTDVCVIKNGTPQLSQQRSIDGLALRVPAYDIETVGAGGGSIAHIDDSGLLKVGPKSAGSNPGPAAYGKGGELPTVTDAHVVIGSLTPEHALGGDLRLDEAKARQVVGRLAERMGLSAEETALGIIRIAVTNMVRTVRVTTVRKGEDPRDYALLPFGGAGPMHACWLAEELGIDRVLVPSAPGVLSAYGQQVADLRFEFSRSDVFTIENTTDAAARAAEVMSSLETTAGQWARRIGVTKDGLEFRWSVDMRYKRQNHELTIPWRVRASADVNTKAIDALVTRFFELHEVTFGHADHTEPVSLVTQRLTVTGSRAPKPTLRTPDAGGHADRSTTSRLYLGGGIGWTACQVVDRNRIKPGEVVRGPALILQFDATTVVLPDYNALRTDLGNLILFKNR